MWFCIFSKCSEKLKFNSFHVRILTKIFGQIILFMVFTWGSIWGQNFGQRVATYFGMISSHFKKKLQPLINFLVILSEIKQKKIVLNRWLMSNSKWKLSILTYFFEIYSDIRTKLWFSAPVKTVVLVLKPLSSVFPEIAAHGDTPAWGLLFLPPNWELISPL